VDWATVEREYRLGQLSLRDLAKAHGCHETAIRRRARKYGWTRDLKHRVQEAVRDTLYRGDAHGEAKGLVESDAEDDALMIQAAAQRGAEVVRQHREILDKGKSLVNMLMDELQEASTYAASLLDAAKAEAAKGGRGSSKLLQYAERAVSLHARSMSANQLSNAMKTMIAEQRKAYNLDDDRDKEDALDAILRTVRNSNKVEASARQRLEEAESETEEERWLRGSTFAPQEELPH
jgi:hypothetical protein